MASSTSRRAKGEGSIYKRPDGRWAAFFTLLSHDGKQRKRWVYGRTKAEAAEKLHALRELHVHAPQAAQSGVGFEVYARLWLEYQTPHIKPSTHATYESELHNHAFPHLGKLPLSSITSAHVRAMQNAVLKASGPVAARHARGRVRTVLQMAYEDGLIARNPASSVRAVAAPKRDFDTWGEAQVDAFLKASTSTRLHSMFYLGLTTGLRPGELLALPWDAVSESTVHVYQTLTRHRGETAIGPPKSAAGNRQVPLPEDAGALLATLPQTHPFVFPSSSGGFMAATNVRARIFKPLLVRAGLKDVRLYVLRHTYASMCIAAGVDAATLSKWMGHTDISFTLSTYGHYFERRQPTKGRTLAQLLGRAKLGHEDE